MPASGLTDGGGRPRLWTPPIITVTDTDADRDLADLFGEEDGGSELAESEESSSPPESATGATSVPKTTAGEVSVAKSSGVKVPKTRTSQSKSSTSDEEMLLHSVAPVSSNRRWASRRKAALPARVGATRTRTTPTAAAPSPPRPTGGRRERPRPHSQMESPRERRPVGGARAKDDSAVGYESDSAWDSVPSRYSDASGQWRARKATFFRNGDPWFQGLQMRFVPGRDYASLEALCAKISDRMGKWVTIACLAFIFETYI